MTKKKLEINDRSKTKNVYIKFNQCNHNWLPQTFNTQSMSEYQKKKNHTNNQHNERTDQKNTLNNTSDYKTASLTHYTSHWYMHTQSHNRNSHHNRNINIFCSRRRITHTHTHRTHFFRYRIEIVKKSANTDNHKNNKIKWFWQKKSNNKIVREPKSCKYGFFLFLFGCDTFETCVYWKRQ